MPPNSTNSSIDISPSTAHAKVQKEEKDVETLSITSDDSEVSLPVIDEEKGAATSASPAQSHAKLPRRQFVMIFVAMIFGVLLVSLDQTIVSTALPDIVSDFGELDLYSWVIISYLITSTAVQPITGKLSDIFGRKAVFLVSISLFTIGSVLCGIAPSMLSLIIFRAIQGAGAGPIFSLCYIITADLVPIRELGTYTAFIGIVYGVSSVLGPLVGGVLTENLSWRWIFYVNIPFSVISIIIIIKEFHIPNQKKLPWREGLKSIDYVGSGLLMSGVIAICLFLSFGGNDYAWKSAPVIVLAIGGGLLLVAFVFWERRQTNPVLNLNLFLIRNCALSYSMSFFMGYGWFSIVSYLPVFFQVVAGDSPTISGLKLLPLMFGVIVSSRGSGYLITRTGRYFIYPVIGAILSIAGFALMARISTSILIYELSVYSLLVGLGVGFVLQTVVLIAQASVEKQYIAVATSSCSFIRTMGSVVGVAVLGTLLNNQLKQRVEHQYLPAVNAGHDAIESLGNPTSDEIFDAYAASIRVMFLSVIPFFVVQLVLALLVRNKKITKETELPTVAGE